MEQLQNNPQLHELQKIRHYANIEMNVCNQNYEMNAKDEAFNSVEHVVETPENIHQDARQSTPESSQHGFPNANGLLERNFIKF